MNTIYGLLDPKTFSIKYVGKTCVSPHKRYKSHITGALQGKDLRVHRWIRSLSELPILYILEIDSVDIDKSEKFWIARFRKDGIDLTNLTSGGDGIHKGYHHTTEARLNMKQSKQNVSEDTKVKMSASSKGRAPWNKGKKLSSDILETYRKAQLGKKHTDATKTKMSCAQKRRFSNSKARAAVGRIGVSRNKGKIPWNKGIRTSTLYSQEV